MSLDLTRMVAEKIQNMNESATIRMAQKARDLADKGVDVISLTLGEPDFDTPQYIKDKATEGLEKGHTKYTPVPGTMELRKAICSKLSKENELEYKPEQIVVSNGAKQSIINIFLSTLNPGDEVIIFTPYWVTYFEQVKFCDAVPITLKAGIEKDFKVTPDQLEQAITSKTKIIIYSSPCNPSGSVFNKNELTALAEVIKRHDNILVISDEIYEYITFNEKHTSMAQISGMKEITAIINGFSKGFAMTGWRLGYMAGPTWLAQACAKVQGQVTSGANSFGQYAAAYAIQNDKSETYKMTSAFKQRRNLVIDLFKDITGFKVNQPDGAFYLFPDVSYYFGKKKNGVEIKDADHFAEILLEEAHVGTVSGSAFGNDNCIRLSYAASEDNLKEAARRIKTTLANYI